MFSCWFVLSCLSEYQNISKLGGWGGRSGKSAGCLLTWTFECWNCIAHNQRCFDGYRMAQDHIHVHKGQWHPMQFSVPLSKTNTTNYTTYSLETNLYQVLSKSDSLVDEAQSRQIWHEQINADAGWAWYLFERNNDSIKRQQTSTPQHGTHSWNALLSLLNALIVVDVEYNYMRSWYS